MAKLTGRRIDDLYRRKVLLLREAISQIIVLAGQEDVSSVVSDLSDELASAVKDEMAKAPTTESDWKQMLIVQGGTFARDYDQDAAMAKAKAEYRAGVEVLRSHFSGNLNSN